MDRNINSGAGIIMVVLMVLVLPDVVHGLKTYECWGGCYNVCLAKAGVSQSERLPCDHQCLDNCIPRNKSDYMYYCEIGCSMKRCIPVSYDGARMESCFGFCTNLCKKLVAAAP